MHQDPPAHELKKSLGLVSLTIYGVGNMLGAGIYGLIGKAAGEMGNAVWMAFVTSLVAAGLTGLSYASLGSRYPRAAGAAYVTHRAFTWPMLAYVVGLAVMASGLTSMATTAQVFAGYFLELAQWADHTGVRVAIITTLIVVLAGVNFWGLRESAWLNAVCTIIEASGLLLIIAVGLRFWGSVDYTDATSLSNPTGELSGTLLLTGAVLTFYAFIGFEDLLNVSEEVKNPRRTFPLALVLAMVLATLIYMGVCVTAVSVVPHDQLAQSPAPLAQVMSVAAPWFSPRLFSLVALFAVLNTALLNYIMGSRLAYGMARQGLLPAFLGRLHASRRTPHTAILILAGIVLVLALSGNVKDLGKATSLLLLASFAVVNASLLVLQRRPGEPRGGFEVPWLVPAGGILVCLAMIGNEIVVAVRGGSTRPLIIAGIIVIGIFVLYGLMRPRNNTEAQAAVPQNPA